MEKSECILIIHISWSVCYTLIVLLLMYFQSYRDLALLSRDGMTIALTKTNQLIFERWLKLLDTSRQQVELKTLHVYIKALNNIIVLIVSFLFSHLQQVGAFLRVLRFPPLIKLTVRYSWNIVESGVKHRICNPYFLWYIKMPYAVIQWIQQITVSIILLRLVWIVCSVMVGTLISIWSLVALNQSLWNWYLLLLH
jgi:hypothetical protein